MLLNRQVSRTPLFDFFHARRYKRRVYAISRHPGIAIATVQANFPNQPLTLTAIVLAVIVTALVPLPYLLWAKPHETKAAAAE